MSRNNILDYRQIDGQCLNCSTNNFLENCVNKRNVMISTKLKFVYISTRSFHYNDSANVNIKHQKFVKIHWKFSAPLGREFIWKSIYNYFHVKQKPCALEIVFIENYLHRAFDCTRIKSLFSGTKKKKVELYRFVFNDRSPYNENAHYCSWTICINRTIVFECLERHKSIRRLCVWLERSPCLLVNIRFYSENKNDLASPMSNDDAKDNTQKRSTRSLIMNRFIFTPYPVYPMRWLSVTVYTVWIRAASKYTTHRILSFLFVSFASEQQQQKKNYNNAKTWTGFSHSCASFVRSFLFVTAKMKWEFSIKSNKFK